jgi:metal-sulfur cluster biosynthetic enzyme
MSDEVKKTTTWQADESQPEIAGSIRERLREVVDPELGLNIIELGLVREVELDNEQANITMILTTPFCPYGPALLEAARSKAQEAVDMPVNIEMGTQMWDFSFMEDGVGADWGLF